MGTKDNKLINIHPGEILYKDFLLQYNVSSYKLSKDIRTSRTTISEIINGNRNISIDIAIKLSRYFNTSIKFWLHLQADYSISEALAKKDYNYIKGVLR